MRFSRNGRVRNSIAASLSHHAPSIAISPYRGLFALLIALATVGFCLSLPPYQTAYGASGNTNADSGSDLVITAQVSEDETRVWLKAQGGNLDQAKSVFFPVWSGENDQDDLIWHPAVQTDDGSWVATIFIAPSGSTQHEVPYRDQVKGAVYRLYNPYTSEHLFTKNLIEVSSLIANDWQYESISWLESLTVLSQNSHQQGQDGSSKTGAINPVLPVYRLYNPISGQHHFTTDKNEYDILPAHNWSQEDVAFYVNSQHGTPVYRFYNAGNGAHHFTSDENERNLLGSLGWTYEGIAWYGAPINADGSWNSTTKNASHCSAGNYAVHVYCETITTEGTTNLEFEGACDFNISAPTATLTITPDNKNGTFTARLSAVSSPSGVESVALPTWSDAQGQDDIQWYGMDLSQDGQWIKTVDVANHGLEEFYHCHAYVTCKNGVFACATTADASLQLKNFIHVNPGWLTRQIYIKNPTTAAGLASQVSAPSWSVTNDQDDLIWYSASNLGNGLWQATISTRNFASSGRCVTHVYGDGTYLGACEYTVDPNELLTIHRDLRNSFDHGPKPAANQKYIVLHDTEGDGNASNTIAWWDSNGNEVASHFIINKDGSIYQAVEMDRIAHHAGYGDTGHNAYYGITEDGRDDKSATVWVGSWCADYAMNGWSIGIELVHSGNNAYPEAQLNALDSLIAYIDAYYGFESTIIDHKAWRSGNSDTSPAFAPYLASYQRTRTHNG